MDRWKDPEYIGPGTWSTIHRLALTVKSDKDLKQFEETVKSICYSFPCKICREHCTNYIKRHPIVKEKNKTKGKSNKLGITTFLWTWRYHNDVNERLNKPTMNLETAINMYGSDDKLVCTRRCEESL